MQRKNFVLQGLDGVKFGILQLQEAVRPTPPYPPPQPHPTDYILFLARGWQLCSKSSVPFIIIILICSLSVKVVWAPQMISQPVSFTFLCSPLPSWTWRTLGLSIPRCGLPTSSSVCLVFFPFKLCLARWFWPDLMNGRHDHTTAVCVSLRWSGGLRVVRLPAGSWHCLPRW